MNELNDWQRRAKSAIKKEQLKEFHDWNQSDFVDHIIELREKIENLDSELTSLKTKKVETVKKEELKESQFTKEWSVPTQIVFILHLLNKPLRSSEIYAKIIQLDKTFESFSDSEVVLSNYLSRCVKSGRIKKIKSPGIRTLYFALPEWVNEKGELDEEFQSVIKLF